MKKLWVFGDSYGIHAEHDPSAVNTWFWAHELAQKLKCVEYHNYSQMGIGNDYIQHLIMECASIISPDDYVIIISTSISRKWFIKDKPWLSNFYVNNLLNYTNPSVVTAINQYLLHLHNPKVDEINFHQFLGWVHYATDKHQWNTIVIPGFDEESYPVSHKYSVKGSLFDICKNEFTSSIDGEWYYTTHCQGRDKRSGHLLKVNHEILSEKVFDVFTKNKELDLSSGFKEGLISRNSIHLLKDQFPV
jgi:hypothetical protein